MLRFLAGRVLQSLLILLGVTMITFGLLFLVPADPVRMIAGRSASAETVESIRRQLGLDQPIPVQYLRYLGNLVQGDLGRSYVQKAEVSELVASRLPATLQHPYLKTPVASFLRQFPSSWVDDEEMPYFDEGSNNFKYDDKLVEKYGGQRMLDLLEEAALERIVEKHPRRFGMDEA